mmetsp:Transcript_27181/g.66113  ORF Transcript_27181/g.66113 Transcript_27181/m.66113 type:complete len:135 (-) Transcript_27181:857-1261(-)
MFQILLPECVISDKASLLHCLQNVHLHLFVSQAPRKDQTPLGIQKFRSSLEERFYASLSVKNIRTEDDVKFVAHSTVKKGFLDSFAVFDVVPLQYGCFDLRAASLVSINVSPNDINNTGIPIGKEDAFEATNGS